MNFVSNASSSTDWEFLADVDGILRKNTDILHAVMYDGFDCRRELSDDDHSM